MINKQKVYVAGPYTKGNMINNINTAISIGDYLLSLGFIPFIPHLTGFWDLIYSHDYEIWLEYDLEWLRECDAVFRTSGESVGADREIEIAMYLGIPVFYQDDYRDNVRGIDRLLAFFMEKE